MEKIKDRKIRNVERSQLLIAYIIGDGIDDFGRRFIQVKWGKEKGEISLGSFAKPTKGIYLIKYIIPSK